MITTDGQMHIKRYLAQQVPVIAQCIAFGIGGKAESAADTSLQFEVGREDIILTSYDFVNDKVIFKASLPDDLDGTIYEAALFSMTENPVAGNYASKLLTTGDSDETWTNANGTSTFSTTNSRLGTDSLHQAPAASTSATDTLSDILFDLSGNSASDTLVFAFNAGANVSGLSVKLMTDSANYFTYTLGAQSAGYQFVTKTKGSAVATGTPDWANITQIQITTTAGAGGAASVDFDGIRIEDTDTVAPEYVMVARDVLTTPFVKVEGQVQEIEFPLSVVIS